MIFSLFFNFYQYLPSSQVASGSDKGRELEAIMKEGKLVSNEAVLYLLDKEIRLKSGAANGFLIDG